MSHPTISIGDISDRRLDDYRDLPRKQPPRDDCPRFIVEGQLLVERLLASRYPVESIVATESAVEQMVALAGPGTPIYVLNNDAIRQLTGFDFHRGVLASARRLPTPDLEQVESVAATPDRWLTLVLLPHIHDPANLGGVLRNCAAFGVDAVILGRRCTDYLGRRVLRVSMGAALNLPILRVDSMTLAIERLRQAGACEVAAATTDGDAITLDSFRRPRRLAVMFGPEDHGLSKSLVEVCDRRVTIPIWETTDSLNVAVASGIFLYLLGNRRIS